MCISGCGPKKGSVDAVVLKQEMASSRDSALELVKRKLCKGAKAHGKSILHGKLFHVLCIAYKPSLGPEVWLSHKATFLALS